ncbi:hypothetical protein AB685_17805 [Bacillus sp. LL01]|uniref:hypothetical protein n=1 Tax=Bacillus sp. LL01 TaxID=1665556 RepID=UPI00064D296C|nr:hypothetical protein [Bacillus sp. LL01]KMJ57255.1 hypothetical protein AB685_17805 [Bacillus sp. LL01]
MKKAVILFISGVFFLTVTPEMAFAQAVSNETGQPNKFIVIVSTIIIILVFSLFKWWKDRNAT